MDYTYLLIAQVVIDFFLIVSLIYLILFVGRKGRDDSEERLKNFINLLERRINDANSVATRVSTSTESSLASIKDLMKGLETKKVELQHYLERIDGILKAIDEVVPPSSHASMPRELSEAPKPRTRYQEASRMVEDGYGVDEIAQRIGIPKGEVQLIMELKKNL